MTKTYAETLVLIGINKLITITRETYAVFQYCSPVLDRESTTTISAQQLKPHSDVKLAERGI